MANGRGAARVGSEHYCELVQPGPHKGGVITTGASTVLVNGKPAATAGSQCECQVGSGNSVMMGHPFIAIQSRLAARRWDVTAHGGRIRYASANVFYGQEGEAEVIAAAIDALRRSHFGQTEEGQKVLKALEKREAEGKIRYITPDDPDTKDATGAYQTGSDEILLRKEECRDPDTAARILTHEGTHAAVADQEGKSTPDSVDEETKAWRNESELYKQQRAMGGARSDANERFLNAPDQEAWVDKGYASRHLPRRP